MNEIDYLLIKLTEECSELSKETCKALIFGLDDKEPGQDLTNREKIINEFNDLFSIMEMLVDKDVFETTKMLDDYSIDKKIDKVKHYMEYSRMKGKLENKK